MLYQDISGRIGMVMAVMVWLVMTGCAVAFGVESYNPGGDVGFAFLPAEMWGWPAWMSLIANMVSVGFTAFFMIVINRHYNFIPGTTLAFAAAFLVFMGADTQASAGLQSSALIAAVNLACVAMLYSQRKGRNASAVMFIITSILSAGSLSVAAYAFFIPVYMVCAIAMGLFGLREMIASLMGVAAPWICAMCFGLVSVDSLHEPRIIPIWEAAPPLGNELVGVGLITTVGLTAVVAGLRNIYSLNAANRSLREMSRCTTIPIVGLLIMLLLDWGHYRLYYGTMALFAAFQIGYLTALLPRRNRAVPLLCALAAGVGLFVLMLLYN